MALTPPLSPWPFLYLPRVITVIRAAHKLFQAVRRKEKHSSQFPLTTLCVRLKNIMNSLNGYETHTHIYTLTHISNFCPCFDFFKNALHATTMSKKERSKGLTYKAQTMKTSKKTPGLDFLHCTHYTCMAGVYNICRHYRMTKKEAQLPNAGMEGLM